MDEAMGIEFTKQLKKRAAVAESYDVDYAASERLIDSKSALLIKPLPQPERFQPSTLSYHLHN